MTLFFFLLSLENTVETSPTGIKGQWYVIHISTNKYQFLSLVIRNIMSRKHLNICIPSVYILWYTFPFSYLQLNFAYETGSVNLWWMIIHCGTSQFHIHSYSLNSLIVQISACRMYNEKKKYIHIMSAFTSLCLFWITELKEKGRYFKWLNMVM
jgi:hypothetical protein